MQDRPNKKKIICESSTSPFFRGWKTRTLSRSLTVRPGRKITPKKIRSYRFSTGESTWGKTRVDEDSSFQLVHSETDDRCFHGSGGLRPVKKAAQGVPN